MSSQTILMVIAILVYLSGMVVIGITYSKKTKDTGDFYLGGRKLSPLTAAMSAEASDMSSWLLLGVPGLAYLTGVADAAWTCIGLALGTYLNWLIVAKRIRAYTSETNTITLPNFFSVRFRDNKKWLSLIAGVVIVVFFVPYTASGFAACGKLFETLFGWDYTLCMVMSAVIIIAYTTLGGFMAASTTDLIQSIVMTIALISVFVFGISAAGGMEAVMENAKALPGYFSLTETFNVADSSSAPYTVLTIASTMAWGLGYFGMPHILLRFMAIEDPKKLTLSRRVATIWVVISMAAAILIGIVGNALSKGGVLGTYTNSDESERLIINLANLIASNGWLAAILGGIILAGILAATMSTADSQLLSAASGVSENICTEFFHAKLSTKKSMIIARVTVIVISLIGIVIALNKNSSVFKIVSFAWAGFGASFGPLVICALFWKRTTKAGAIAGMISGGAMVFIWKFLIAKLGGVFAIYELLPAFLISLAVIIIVSLCTKAPSKEITDEFDRVKASLK